MRLWVEPAAVDEIAALPGHMRQRIRHAVRDLGSTPRPAQCRPLDIPEDLQFPGVEAPRLRSANSGIPTSRVASREGTLRRRKSDARETITAPLPPPRPDAVQPLSR